MLLIGFRVLRSASLSPPRTRSTPETLSSTSPVLRSRAPYPVKHRGKPVAVHGGSRVAGDGIRVVCFTPKRRFNSVALLAGSLLVGEGRRFKPVALLRRSLLAGDGRRFARLGARGLAVDGRKQSDEAHLRLEYVVPLAAPAPLVSSLW